MEAAGAFRRLGDTFARQQRRLVEPGFVDQPLSMFMGGSPDELATENGAAEAIVAAASDDSEQLRYFVGGDCEASAWMR